MDKVFKPFEDLVSKMDEQKKNSFVPLVANAHKFTGRNNSGAGLNSLGKFDVEQLALGKNRMFENYDFDDKESVEKYVRSVRNNEVDDDMVNATFEILPKKLKQTWGKKGMAGKGELGRNHFLGYDEDGNETTAPVLSENYHVDVLWKDIEEVDEDGNSSVSHPYGWASYAIDIDTEGMHGFMGVSYLENKL